MPNDLLRNQRGERLGGGHATPLPPGFVLDPIAREGRVATVAPVAPPLPDGFVLDNLRSDEEADRLSQPAKAKKPSMTGGALLTDEEVDRLSQSSAVPALPEGFVLDSRPDDSGDVSIAGGLLRSVGQGATAEFGDEIVGLAGGDDAKESYRKKIHQFEEEHPYLDMAGKGVGAVGSTVGLMLTPGGQIPALGRAAAAGQKVLSGLKSLFGATNTAKAIPNANAAVSAGIRNVPFLGRAAQMAAGTNARRGGLAAMQYGATSRAGQYEGAPDIEGDGRDGFDSLVDDGTGRLSAAFDPSAMALDYTVGTGLTKGLNKAAPTVSGWIDGMRTLAARARNEAGAQAGPIAVAKRLQADRVTPQQMRDQVLPSYRGMSQDNVAGIMERYGDLIAGGADDVTARQTISGELAQGGANPSTAERQVRTIVQRYQDRNAVPSQLNELAAIAQGGDAVATHRQFESGINMARDGSEASRVSEFMTGRQPQTRAVISDALEDQLGDGDVGRMLNDYDMRRAASNESYQPFVEAFNGDPQAQQALRRAIDLSRIEIEGRLGNRADDMAKEVRAQLTKFTNPETLTLPRGSPLSGGQEGPRAASEVEDLGRRGTMDLEGFIHQRRALTDAIEGSRKEFRDTATTHDLRDLKGTIDRQVRAIANDESIPPETRKVFSDWAESNDSRARLAAARRAFQTGSGLNITAKGGTSLMNMEMAMRRLDRMRPDEQEMFARGVMSQIKGKIDTGGDFHDVAKIFNNRRMRNVLGRMMGQERANDFYQLVRRASLATRSARADKNSPTARIRDEEKASRLLSKLMNAVDTYMSPSRAVGAALDLADDVAVKRKNEAVMRVLGTNTDQPQDVIRTLRSLEQAMRYQEPTAITPLVRDGGPFFSLPLTQGVRQSDEETWH